MGYRNTFLKGVGWHGSMRILAKVIALGKLAIISRILTPADFGGFALVLIAISLFEVLTETGINIIIVQSEKKIEEFIDTAWIISIGRGILIAGLMVLAAYPMRWFYHEPALPMLILIAAAVPLTKGFINPAMVSLYKDLQYHRDSLFKFSLVIIETVATIGLAFVFRSPLALVIPLAVSAVAEVGLSFVIFSPRPKWKFDKKVFTEIMHGMKWLNGLFIVEYLRKTADDIILGRLVGTNDLGIYRVAYNLPQSSTTELGNSVMYSSFPLYKKLTTNVRRVRRAFFKIIGGASGLLLIPTILMVAFPGQIISIILGDQWTSATQILPLLAIGAYLQGIEMTGTTFLTAHKAYSKHFWVVTISMLTLVVSLFPLVYMYGLRGAGWSVIISRLVSLPSIVLFISPYLVSENYEK